MGFDWHLPLQHRRILKLYHKICLEKRWRLSILNLAPTWSAAIDLYQVVSCRRVINNTAKKLSLFWWQTVMKMTWSVGRPFQGEIFSDSNQRESFGGWLGRVKSDQLQMLRTTRTEDRRLGASPPYVEKNRWHETKGKLPLKIYQFVRKENEKDIYMKCGSSHPSFSSNWQVKLSVKSDQAGLSLEKMCSTDWSKIARKCVRR